MSSRFRFAVGVLGLCATAASFAAGEEKPLDWHELITVAQNQPTTDLKWGTGKAQIVERHREFQQTITVPSVQGSLAKDVSDGVCSFVVRPLFDRSSALAALTLELPRTAPPECGQKWLTALQALYGKPLSSGPVSDIVLDADTPLQTYWRTPTSCVSSTYTGPGAPHPGPFILEFGDEKAGACGYDDPVPVSPRKKQLQR